MCRYLEIGPLGGIRIGWGQECGALKVESVFSEEAMPESLYPVSLTTPSLPSGGYSEKQLPAAKKRISPELYHVGTLISELQPVEQ